MGKMTVAKLEDRLNDWTATHNKKHVTDDSRLNTILEKLSEHDKNHHGAKSQAKTVGLSSGLVIGVIALLTIIAEIVRAFVL